MAFEYNPCLDRYLYEAEKHYRVLSGMEELNLLLRIRGGDEKAEEKLVNSNLLFVVTIAREYQGRGLSLADLVSAGNEGLIKAARRFSVGNENRFITYAAFWIRQTIQVALAEESRNVRVPVNRLKAIIALKKADKILAHELGRFPTREEIGIVTGWNGRGGVAELQNLGRPELSLDFPAGGDSEDSVSFLDLIPNIDIPPRDDPSFWSDFLNSLEEALWDLGAMERMVVKLYFGLYDEDPLTYEQIGLRIGRTKERVRQILNKALKALRHHARAYKLEVYYDVLKAHW